MTPQEVYRAWIPEGAPWSLWAIPVLFAHLEKMALYSDRLPAQPLGESPDVSWAPSAQERTALVLDLPGAESVYLAVTLASHGYCPVPLFAGCSDVGETYVRELVAQEAILDGLTKGAPAVAQAHKGDVPVFLLDSLRLRSRFQLTAGMFDNRWMVFPADVPSATHLREKNISSALWVHRGKGEADIAHVLRRWHKGGVKILHLDLGPAETLPQPLPKGVPTFLLWTWCKVTQLTLHGDKVRGFGEYLPSPSQQSSGNRWASHG